MAFISSKPLSSTAEEYVPSAAMSPIVFYFTPPIPTSAASTKQYFPAQPFHYYYPYINPTTPAHFITPCYFIKSPPSNASFFNSEPLSGYVTKETQTQTPTQRQFVDSYTKRSNSSYGLKLPRRSCPRKLWLRRGNNHLSSEISDPHKTTLMIRNIPNQLRRHELMEFLKKRCCQQESDSVEVEFDFLYLPMDFRKHKNLGYAFVNFTSEAAAGRVMEMLHNWKWTPMYRSSKVCKIDWGRIQGKDALVRRFMNTYFHCSDSEYLPVVLCPGRGNSETKDFATVGRCAAAAAKIRVRAKGMVWARPGFRV